MKTALQCVMGITVHTKTFFIWKDSLYIAADPCCLASDCCHLVKPASHWHICLWLLRIVSRQLATGTFPGTRVTNPAELFKRCSLLVGRLNPAAAQDNIMALVSNLKKRWMRQRNNLINLVTKIYWLNTCDQMLMKVREIVFDSLNILEIWIMFS